jgi:hypothetical protein
MSQNDSFHTINKNRLTRHMITTTLPMFSTVLIDSAVFPAVI